MERFILKELLAWKNSPYRKPLILKGVRQVGKTWILKEFGRRYNVKTPATGFNQLRGFYHSVSSAMIFIPTYAYSFTTSACAFAAFSSFFSL